MSQLNLKQILAGDTISTVVDKINYNFDQIVLNGGGPRGLRGLLGSPGLIGKQGTVGETGPTGEDGTYLYASGSTPGVYPFGTGGENLPRPDDVFLEGGTSFINIWTASQGASGIEWNLEATVTAPGGGLSKLVYDSFATGSTFTSFANDPAIAGQILLGSPESMNSSLVIDPAFDINSATPKKVPELSSPFVYGDSTFTVVSSQNQLRLLNFDENFLLSPTINGGGIVHTIETVNPTGTDRQIYRVTHGDISGDKFFTLNLSSAVLNVGNAPVLMHANFNNQLAIGGEEFGDVQARLSVNESIAVGRLSTNFYGAGASFTQFTDNGVVANVGALFEGNLAVGKNNNNLATAGFYSLDSSTNSGKTNVIIDAEQNSSASRYSELQIGSNVFLDYTNPGQQVNWWKFKHVATSASSNSLYTGLRLSGFSTLRGGSADAMYFSLTASGGIVSPRIGVNNLDPISLFEVGSTATRIGIGDFVPTGGSANSFISFNLHRSHTGTWTRRGNSQGNAGRAFWSNQTAGLGLSLFRSDSTNTVSNITDAQLFEATRLYINPRGWFSIAPTGNSPLVQNYPVVFNFGSGDLDPGSTAGDPVTDNNGYKLFRRHIAQFGLGSSENIKGSPLISTTRGLTPSASGLTDSIFPQYTFHNDFGYGVYLGGGNTANGMTGVEVGFSVGGTAGITVLGGYGTADREPRLGINNRRPLSRAHFGNLLTLEEGTQNYLGYNLYYDRAAAENLRIFSSSANPGTWRGFGAYRFNEKLYTSGDTDTFGVSLRLSPGVPGTASTPAGGTSSFSPGSTGTVSYVEISPSLSQWSAGGAFVVQSIDSSAPQMRIGVLESSNVGSYLQPMKVRGTLQVAPQKVNVLVTGTPLVQDDYNLSFTDRFSTPVLGFAADSTSSTNSLVMRFMQRPGGPSSTNNVSVSLDPIFLSTSSHLTDVTQRYAFFGNNIRIGVGATAVTDAAFYSRGSTTTPMGGATAAAKFDGDILIGEDLSGVFDIRTGGDPRGIIQSSQILSVFGSYYTVVSSTLTEFGGPSQFLTNMNSTFLYKRIGRTVFLRLRADASSFTNSYIGTLYFKFSDFPINLRPANYATMLSAKTLGGSGVIKNNSITPTLYSSNKTLINSLTEASFLSCSIQPDFTFNGELLIKLSPIDKFAFYTGILPSNNPGSVTLDFNITYEL